MTTYSYSFDEEQYYGDYPSVEDAIADAVDSMDEGQNIFVGENKRYTAHHFVDPSILLEQAMDRADDEVGEWSEGWLGGTLHDYTKMAELKKLVGDWIQANDPPQFYSVVNVREITPAEINEAKK